ncbi:unnamed protein product [Cuscuta campestris]|uniref:CCHC-type domain-containing protein n=1 Tax=Cuscuta campestris TaxID=132261 RepID=A0A484MQQ5_9ASTE|nr:unnamed protein product [Cuscuta campestris]
MRNHHMISRLETLDILHTKILMGMIIMNLMVIKMTMSNLGLCASSRRFTKFYTITETREHINSCWGYCGDVTQSPPSQVSTGTVIQEVEPTEGPDSEPPSLIQEKKEEEVLPMAINDHLLNCVEDTPPEEPVLEEIEPITCPQDTNVQKSEQESTGEEILCIEKPTPSIETCVRNASSEDSDQTFLLYLSSGFDGIKFKLRKQSPSILKMKSSGSSLPSKVGISTLKSEEDFSWLFLLMVGEGTPDWTPSSCSSSLSSGVWTMLIFNLGIPYSGSEEDVSPAENTRFLQPSRLLDPTGYDYWKIMMEAHLYALHDCMWMVLEDGPLKIQMENPERNPAGPDVVQYIPKPKEKWDDRDCKKHNLDNVAKAAIFKTLDPITFSKIKHLKTAMEIWQGLGKLCEGSEDLRKQKIEVLLEKFKSFKMLPGESFDMLDERFHKILNDLASLNYILSPKEKNVRLLRSLPTEWYTKATSMEEGRNLENNTVQGLFDELRTYENELKKKKEEQVTPFPTALMTTPRIPSSEGTCTRNCDTPSSSQLSSSKMENYDEEFSMMVKQFRKFKKFFRKADSVRRPSKGKPQVSDSPPESYLCYNCRKPGHWKSAFPYPKVEKYGERERNEKKKKAMVAAESDESSSSSSDEEALVCMERKVEKSNHGDRWTIIPTSENLFDQFKKMMEEFEEINLKHSSLTEENKLLSGENLKLTESRKSQLNEITQLKTENESLSEKVKSLNKELGILKSKKEVNKLLETTKHKGREGLEFDPSSSKKKGKTTFIPPKPTAKPNKQKGRKRRNQQKFPKRSYQPRFARRKQEIAPPARRKFYAYNYDYNPNKFRAARKIPCNFKLDVGTHTINNSGPKLNWHDHEVLDLSDKDEEVNEGDRMKPTEFIPFRSLPLKTSQRNPDSNSAEPTGNLGQPSNIPDHSNGDNSGNGDPVPIHPETPTSVLQPEAELDQPVNPNQHNLRWLRDHPPQQKLEGKCSSPTFYQSYLEMIAAQELSEFLHMEIRFKYENEVLEFYKNGKVKTVKLKKDPLRTIQVINSTVGGTKLKLSQKKLGEKLHLPNSGVKIGRLPAKNLDWNIIGISRQAPSGPAKKADLNNDYKLVLELVIACLECGSGGHADDITQERGFIINALITKSKVNWAAHFFNSISKHLGKPNQKYLCQGLYIGHILESLCAASEGKKYEARYWLYYLSSIGENRAGASTTTEESSSDNVLIMSLNKSVKRKHVVSPSSNAEALENLALINLEEEEEISAQGELRRKKKRKITSPSTSGNVNRDELKEKEPVEENSAHNQSPQQPDEEIPQSLESWKFSRTLEHLVTSPVSEFEADDEDPAVYRPIFSKATKDQVAPTTKAQADMEATAEDFQIFLETSPAIETVLTEADQENAASTPQEQNQEASEEELQQLLHSQALEILTTPCEITNPTETEILEKSADNLEMSKPLEANEVQEEQAVEAQRSSAEDEKETQMA